MSETRLKPDGERFLPEFSGTIELEHYHRYFVARELISGMDVLDIACGEGFADSVMAQKAASDVGGDIAPKTVPAHPGLAVQDPRCAPHLCRKVDPAPPLA